MRLRLPGSAALLWALAGFAGACMAEPSLIVPRFVDETQSSGVCQRRVPVRSHSQVVPLYLQRRSAG